MTSEMAISKYPYKDLFQSYLSFDSINKDNSMVRSGESLIDQLFLSLNESLMRSQEGAGIDYEKIIKTFVSKAIEFIGNIIKTILRIISSVITFFKKLILNTMSEQTMKSYGEFYESHKDIILKNYIEFGDVCYVNAIPPKSINSFSSDSKIVLSVQRTVNLLEEIDRSFKQRVELWDSQNKRVNAQDSNTIFDQLKKNIGIIKTNISDSILLAKMGIRIQYDIKAISLYDAQVKDYIFGLDNNSKSGDFLDTTLFTVFSIPKRITNIFLFGKEDVKPTVISISTFLQATGYKEFDKLSYNDMNKIKANTLTIEGLTKKMDIIAKRLQTSGDKFCKSLSANVPAIVNLYMGDSEKARDATETAKEWILPLLSLSNAFYSYFNSIIINYSMYYYHHRKALAEAAKVLIDKSRVEDNVA
jgi:hypothetical protein